MAAVRWTVKAASLGLVLAGLAAGCGSSSSTASTPPPTGPLPTSAPAPTTTLPGRDAWDGLYGHIIVSDVSTDIEIVSDVAGVDPANVETGCNLLVREMGQVDTFPAVGDARAGPLWAAELAIADRAKTTCRSDPRLTSPADRSALKADWEAYVDGIAGLQAALTAP